MFLLDYCFSHCFNRRQAYENIINLAKKHQFSVVDNLKRGGYAVFENNLKSNKKAGFSFS